MITVMKKNGTGCHQVLSVPTLVAILILSACSLGLQAQELATRLAAGDYHLSPDDTQTLAVDVDALAFFKDNEFAGDLVTGYTLPGFWIQPRITYQPLDDVRIEAGFHALVFDGANKYPCFAYHDIAQWKGDQYQSGAHLLPFFRAQAQLGSVNLVLGNIYGGANHGVVEPLMNAEVNLTQDPEMGFQVLVDRPRYHLDAWINWQSFTFREAPHQEALTAGISQRIALNAPQSPLAFYIPVDFLFQHRGGEIDSCDRGMVTIDNAAIGLGLQWKADGKVFNGLKAEALGLACWQQWGDLWPFENGFAGSLMLSADFFRQLRVFATTVWPTISVPSTAPPSSPPSSRKTVAITVTSSLPTWGQSGATPLPQATSSAPKSIPISVLPDTNRSATISLWVYFSAAAPISSSSASAADLQNNC